MFVTRGSGMGATCRRFEMVGPVFLGLRWARGLLEGHATGFAPILKTTPATATGQPEGVYTRSVTKEQVNGRQTGPGDKIGLREHMARKLIGIAHQFEPSPGPLQLP